MSNVMDQPFYCAEQIERKKKSFKLRQSQRFVGRVAYTPAAKPWQRGKDMRQLHAMANSELVDTELLTTVQEEFQRLARQWREETFYTSSMTEIASHPAYQKIIQFGRDVLPSIFSELRERPGHWFHALKVITGADPVLAEDRGRINKMRDAWLNWATQLGYYK